MKRFCFALDLKDDKELIEEYKRYHESVWPEITSSILKSGILQMEIYIVSNRLFLIMETTDTFSLREKAVRDSKDPKVQEWEALMWKYQQALPTAKEGEKWLLMEKIFELDK